MGNTVPDRFVALVSPVVVRVGNHIIFLAKTTEYYPIPSAGGRGGDSQVPLG